MKRTVSINEFESVLKADIAKFEEKVRLGIKLAAKEAVPHVQDRTPKAFGELRDSTHAVTSNDPHRPAQLRVDAPHAQAVEIGSRPHMVPIEDLTAWVKLRGMQGLRLHGPRGGYRGPSSKMAHSVYGALHGTSTLDMARQVAGALKALEKNGSSDVNAPEIVARAIQQKIATVGTSPHKYVSGSIDTVIKETLDREIRLVLGK